MGTVITLTTDFGLADAYVAAMKGVILGINPEVRLVDICHTVKPQDIAQAAYILSTAYEFFPHRTIHVVVVDPGVGTKRGAIILRTPSADFVAPDNGVLSYVILRSLSKEVAVDRQQIELESPLEAVAITQSRFWRAPVSATFHGRDIFAPVAAYLSLGTPLEQLGETITSLTVLPLPHPHVAPDGTLVGRIIHIDNFGNLITNIKVDALTREAGEITVEVGNQLISGLSRTYGEGEGLVALIGSSGYLEIALKEGDASVFLGAEAGQEVRIRREREMSH